MDEQDLSHSVIFPRGEKIESANFNGGVWVEMIVPSASSLACPIGNVTFEPGCRNKWHKHPGGQILLVTAGSGWYQERGCEARQLHAGDVVEIERDVEHWHGAAADSWFVHLAIMVNANAGPTRWLEPLSDQEYDCLMKEGQK